MEEKRLEQLREAWIKNVMKNLGKTKEEAEVLYDKIKPHNELK